jgi:hypothetical protein
VAGSYTLAFPPDNPGPGGYGYATAKVDAGGLVTWSGALADGTKVLQSSAVSRQGVWPLYAGPYTGKGVLLGWMRFAATDTSDLTGKAAWMKPAGVVAPANYPAGFTNLLDTVGSAYRQALGTRVLNFSLGELTLSGGGLGGDITRSVRLETSNRITNLSAQKLTLTLTPTSGLFRGSVPNPVTGRALPFQGVLFQKGTMGVGYFLNGTQAGQVELAPAQ